MTNTNNIIIEATATETKFPTNRNCKKVKNLTTGEEYGSITETAIVLKTSAQAVSHAIINKHLCKGNKLMLLKDLHDNIEEVCDESAKANRRAVKANERAEREAARADKLEEKLTSMEEEMAEYRKWKAEQEAQRKAEEAKRREEEKHQKQLDAAKAKVERWEKKLNAHNALGRDYERKLMQAEMELEALLDEGKEVK